MSDNTTVVSDFNESLRGLGTKSNLPVGHSTLRSQLRTTSPSLRNITLALNPDLKKQLTDATKLDIKDINPELFKDTLRKLTALEIQTLRDKFANPTIDLGQKVRDTSRAIIKPMTAEELAAVDFGAQAKTTSEITAEEAARLVSSEVQVIEAKKVIEQQTLDAKQAQQIADLQAQQIRDLQAAEVARRANEIDTPKFLDTVGGSLVKIVAKAAVGVGLATVAPPVIGLTLN